MRRKRAIINTITAIIYQLITLAVGLILPKLYTETFGSTYNGLNQTISQIMRLLAVLQAGIGAASIQALLKPIAENDIDTINAIFKYTDKQYKRMGYIFIVLLFGITITWTLIGIEDIPRYIIPSFLGIYGLSSCMEYFFQAKYNIILIANNRSYFIYIVNIFLFLVSTILRMMILINIKNITLYLLVLIVVAFLRMFIMKVYIKRYLPFLNNETPVKHFEIKQRRDVLISEIAGMVISSTDLIVLTMNCGLIYASIYSVYNFVVSGLENILSSVREGFFAGLGQIYYENFNKFKQRFDEFETLYFLLMFILYSIAIILYRPFIEIYTAKMDANYIYIYFPLMFVLMNLLVSLRIPSIILINTVGHFKQVKKYAVIEAIINLFVSFVLSLKIEIYGVLIGSILGGLYRTPILVGYANNNIAKRNNSIYLLKVSILSIPFLLSSILSLLIDFSVDTFIDWIWLAVIVSIIILLIYAIVLYFLEKDLVKRIANDLFIKIKKTV